MVCSKFGGFFECFLGAESSKCAIGWYSVPPNAVYDLFQCLPTFLSDYRMNIRSSGRYYWIVLNIDTL